ncbi:hypothetical protein B1207_04545 [Legionella quinlivanii]|uniref:Glycosyl transferase family 1 domain-containing protein n=1 Tax=Legionella quinlivanii TaxID=45073 RepID=A0A364LLN1_9GAMM|nr:glycosyltransferase [Legionella quinlivanii]RAP37448.1 hypothetical protein B1207_04545 [Legionella quinlivanii]
MSVKKTYGIYLAYPPTIDLRDQGLGRHLAAFLKGAIENCDAQFIIVSPSWSKKSIYALMKAEEVPANSFHLFTPRYNVISLKLFNLYSTWVKYRKKKKDAPRKRFVLFEKCMRQYELLKSKFIGSTNILQFLMCLVALIVTASLLYTTKFIIHLFKWLSDDIKLRYRLRKVFKAPKRVLRKVVTVFINPKQSATIFSWFRQVEDQETNLMLEIINNLKQVKAWYSPTAFWPSFNRIQAPRLMCVPDVVLGEFPVGFSFVGGDRFINTFNDVEEAILNGHHFVTYSEHIKHSVLVQKYKLNPEQVSVITHAPNTLDNYLNDESEQRNNVSIERLSESLLQSALKKSSFPEYVNRFGNTQMKYLFYASQFRPSKNILTLLKAYHYLLKKSLVTHKLVLTGKPKIMDEIDNYIAENCLQKDVLLLSGLSVKELAACYKLADLAVNPSLSEGGCPFTFTEALSVGTPVIMANIPVTREIISDPHLQELMLFDPYDWYAMAQKIKWAIANKNQLLDEQIPAYKALMNRKWNDVVSEYIAILDRITHHNAVGDTVNAYE